MVILVAPGLVRIGIPDLSAHMYVFYFAMLSAITPPVAVAVAVGSRIADADFMLTAKQALRIGAPGFLIPYAFITNRSLIYWSLPETPVLAAVVLVGVVALVAATTGYDGKHDLGAVHRIAYLILAVLALYAPAVVLQVAAAVLALAGLALVQLDRFPARIAPAE